MRKIIPISINRIVYEQLSKLLVALYHYVFIACYFYRTSAVVKELPNRNKKGGTKYKDELDLDDLPPIEELRITVPEEECEPLGTVCSIVNQLGMVLFYGSFLFKSNVSL